jgi:altronate hydrolase
MNKFIILSPADNVGVALAALSSGESAGGAALAENIPAAHKFALKPIAKGENVIKYGLPIGHAVADIPAGGWVHTHNVKTNLCGEDSYTFVPSPSDAHAAPDIPSFQGFRRANGKVGIRNEIWIVPTVGCVNRTAERLAAMGELEKPASVDIVVAFPHPFGCSQLGDDHETTRHLLANMALHPNAGGVLFVGLGCENNTMPKFRELVESLPGRNPNIAYMVTQEEEDEEVAGMRLLRDLTAKAAAAKRESVPVSELCVGLKCGGSDGLSGVTANPLLGAFSDWLVDRGGKIVLSEVPEMFGAEVPLLNRSVSPEVFEKGVAMINDFKRYFTSHGQDIYENPSPGNKDGGITTLEDKSLGCTQKAGNRPVVDILPYGGVVEKPGVTLLSGPGNDIVAVTALTAAGAHMVLFTTGRGTPLGGPAPVVKVSTNSALAEKKPHWIDFNAGQLVETGSMSATLANFIKTVMDTASGSPTRSEERSMHDFAIFKDGVTL